MGILGTLNLPIGAQILTKALSESDETTGPRGQTAATTVVLKHTLAETVPRSGNSKAAIIAVLRDIFHEIVRLVRISEVVGFSDREQLQHDTSAEKRGT